MTKVDDTAIAGAALAIAMIDLLVEKNVITRSDVGILLAKASQKISSLGAGASGAGAVFTEIALANNPKRNG